MKVSKALSDVWKWKEEIYQDIKDMTPAQRIAYFRRGGELLAQKTGRRLNLPTATGRRRGDPR